MINFTIYGQPYLVGSKLVKPEVTISAVQPYSFYKPYDYCTVNVSDKPMLLSKYMVHDKSSADEWITRASRTVFFADETKLAPQKFSKKHFGDISTRFYSAGSHDHVTFWMSASGVQYILNEPYSVDPNYTLNLLKQGLVAIIVPTEISPYCGSWDPVMGAKPGTTSYLICNLKDANQLTGLLSNFYSALVPDWNCVKGVHHV